MHGSHSDIFFLAFFCKFLSSQLFPARCKKQSQLQQILCQQYMLVAPGHLLNHSFFRSIFVVQEAL